jgi:O-acetyl-ADP-ribose deacetylase (regulator of RNase III)
VIGDVLEQRVDALICTANPHLRMSGGVNGAILMRGGEAMQRELDAHLTAVGRKWLPPASVVVTGPGPLEVRHVVHAVAIDGFYRSSPAMVAQTIQAALAEVARLGDRTAAMPALATGYGQLPMSAFAQGLAAAVPLAPVHIDELRLVLRTDHEAEAVRAILGAHNTSSHP